MPPGLRRVRASAAAAKCRPPELRTDTGTVVQRLPRRGVHRGGTGGRQRPHWVGAQDRLNVVQPWLTAGRCMSMRWARVVVGAGLMLAASSPAWASAPPSAPNCPILPADNVWHADISGLPVDGHSGAWMASANAASTRLHPDFGSSGDPNAPYGIPWIAVPDSHSKVTPSFDYADESDPGPYPFRPDTP